jgi:hypothetical protein
MNMNITIYKQKNKKKTKRNYKKTKRNKYKKTKRRKYNTKRRKYNKRGGAVRADEVVESVPTDFPDGEPLDCREIKGKTLYVSKSIFEDDDDYDLIYVMNDFENGKWEEGDLQPIILTSAPTKIGLLLKSFGEYIPVDPEFQDLQELIEDVRGETVPEADYDEEDITGKVLFEVTPDFIESKKSELFAERLKHCKTCVIGAGPGQLSDFYRWSAHDRYFIGFSHMDPLLVEPFTANWISDPLIFDRGFRMCKSHLPNGKFEHIFIDWGTIQHLDEATDAFTPLIQAIIITDISDRLCIDDRFFRKIFIDLSTDYTAKRELIERYFNITEEIIEIAPVTRDHPFTFHIFTKKT